ncbi:MAG TPA: 50S ribosomal protein L21 [Candidatus Limnocylindria bacterium]|jgi:large subunit ribosomal protein L21|nr:50S ribosomal protein L21 [Candidatus Limnocylindria bacterium]
MYAVVDNGGKQYRVEAGTTLVIDRLDAEAGASVTFDRVLLIVDDDDVTVGTPTVEGAAVHATVVEHGRGPKIIVFKFRPKAHYRRKTGHRSELTKVHIDEIATASSGRRKAAKAEAAETAPAETPTKAAAKASTKTAATKAATAKPAAPRRKPAAKPTKAAPAKD